MKIILFTTLILVSTALLSQNTFFKDYKCPSHEIVFSAVQANDGSFLLTGERRLSGYNDINMGYLSKISATGEIIQENLFNPVNSARITLILPYSNETASYLCIGSADSLYGNSSYGNIFFIGIDTNLNVVYEKSTNYMLNYNKLPWQYIIQNDTILYLMSDINPTEQNPGLNSRVMVDKFNLPNDSLGSYITDYFSVSCDLQMKSDNSALDLYVFPSRRRITVDENLNYLTSSNYPSGFGSNICLTPLCSSDYLITGAISDTYSDVTNLGCYKLNIQNMVIESLNYNHSLDSNFYAGGRKNTIISNGYIYIAGFYNVHPMWFPYNYNPSWVTITKLDMDLNMISTHFYGGDAQYCPYSIIPTFDGGVFVTGYSYDYINNLPNGNYELDIFALKTDADGLITELPYKPQAKAHDAIVYPNPGIEYLNIQSGPQITGAELYLFDIQGKPVLTEKITNTQLKINAAYLPSGTYLWQIVFKNKVIENGKWVKK